jgi:hypothetical protein
VLSEFMNTEHKVEVRVNEVLDEARDAAVVAAAELAAVLEALGIGARVLDDPLGPDLELPGGVQVEVKVSSRPTISRLERLGLARPSAGTVTVLVADQLDPGARKALKDSGWGWLDRTGHIRIIAGAVQIDRPVPSLTGPDPQPPDPLRRPSGLAVALELLTNGGSTTVRALARGAGVSVAAAHAVLGELATSGLVADGRARHPDLFWAVADRWRLRWFPLVSQPTSEIPDTTHMLLRMRLGEPSLAGWAEVGDRAAQNYGARVAAEGPRRFYLPDRRALTWTLRTWGEASEARSASCLVTVPPTGHATTGRVNAGGDWPCARPLVVALDLASDGSPRSREILDRWTPSPSELRRVW